jgi:hypothetical protein
MTLRTMFLALVVGLVVNTADAATFNVKLPPYGAAGDGVTDDTAAIQSAAAALQAAHGGTLYFPPGTYRIFSAGIVWPSFMLTYFSGLTGVTILGEAATIAIDPAQTFPSQASGAIFAFRNCTNIMVDGFTVTGPTMPISQTNSFGLNYVMLYGGNKNVRLPNNKVSGCLAAVNVTRDVTWEPKSDNVWIGNLDVENCFYAINSNNSPDNLTAEHVTTYQVTRSYVTYGGTRNHKVKVISRGSWSYNCVIGSAAENIDLDYTSGADFSGSSTEHAHVRLAFGPASSYLRNITLRLNITYGTSTAGGPALRFFKDSDVPQRLDGLTITGYVKGQPNSTYGDAVGPIIGSYEWSPWSSSDHFTNIALRDLRLESSKTVRFILPGLVGPVTIDHVDSDTAILLSESASDFSPPSGGSYTITASRFANLAAAVTGVANPLEYIRGGGNRTIPAGWSGHTVTNAGNGSGVAWWLPGAVPGLEYTIARNSIFFIRLYPAAGESIRGGGIGKYLEFASDGANVHLRCITPGTWEILSSSGSLLFEP